MEMFTKVPKVTVQGKKRVAQTSRPANAPEIEKSSAIILAVALLIGALLRFHALAAYELTNDEAMSWFPASSATLADIVRQGVAFNPGNLAVHVLALHFWILAFGDSVESMRALSAILGVVCIFLVFLVAKELLQGGPESFAGPRDRDWVGATSALVFALSLVGIYYSREARMYALLLAVTLAQVYFFLRALRTGRLAPLLVASCLSFLSVAVQLVAVAVLIAEGLWLLALVARRRSTRTPVADVWKTMACLVPGLVTAGLIFLFIGPFIREATGWIQSPGTSSNLVLGFSLNTMCALTVGLAVWGTIYGWRHAREPMWFALLSMWVPVVPIVMRLQTAAPALYLLGSFWFPTFLHRYMLTSIVPFAILVAFGIRCLPHNSARICALSLFMFFALIRADFYYQSPWEGVGEWGFQWREAAAAALSELRAGRPVAVYPSYRAYALFYYAREDIAALPSDSRWASIAGDRQRLIASAFVSPNSPDAYLMIDSAEPWDSGAPAMRRRYPNTVAHFFGIAVRSRQLPATP